MESESSQNFNRTPPNPCTEETVKKLSNGLLNIYEQPFIKIQKQLSELTNKQNNLIENLEGQNNELNKFIENSKIKEMVSLIKYCKDSLVDIRKDMLQIHDMSTKLKKRALRIQEIKEKELEKRKLQILKEQELVPKKSK